MFLELEYKLNFLVERQKRDSNKLAIITNDIRKGFSRLDLRNEESLNSNDWLNKQLDGVFRKLDIVKGELKEKAAHRKNGQSENDYQNMIRLIQKDTIC